MRNALWRKGLVIFLIGLFIGGSVIPSISSDEPVFGNTIYVDDDGGADYTSIQDAIDATSNGDTVYVYSGTYYKNIIIDKSIVLIGEDADTTKIDGNYAGNVVEINASNVNIEEFLITNSGSWPNAGIRINSSYNEISNCKLSNNNVSIYAYLTGYPLTSNKNIIIDCDIYNGFYGIYLRYSCENTIKNINMNNIERCAVHLWQSSNNTITHNFFYNASYGIHSDGGNCENNYIFNNYFNASSGIQLAGNDNSKIIQNIIENNNGWRGIDLIACENCIVENNTVSQCAPQNLWIQDSSNCIIKNNIIFDISENSILLLDSTENIFMNNTISGGVFGGEILLSNSGMNEFRYNKIYNLGTGIRIDSTSQDNVFNFNSILGVSIAIQADNPHNDVKLNYFGTSKHNQIKELIHGDIDFTPYLDYLSADVMYINDTEIWTGDFTIEKGIIVNGNVFINNCQITFRNQIKNHFIQVNGNLEIDNSSYSPYNNHFSTDLCSIIFLNTSQGRINNSTFSNYCISSQGESDLTIRFNTFYNGTAVNLFKSQDIDISNNVFKNNFIGLNIFNSNNIHIYRNQFYDNYGGIFLFNLSRNINISKNEIKNNSFGIYDFNSNNLTIFLNNFIGNEYNALSSSNHPNNLWHSPVQINYTYEGMNYSNYLGNYWDDYTGNDADGDGLGDNPYPIPGGTNYDNYPLMDPWSNGNQHLIYVDDDNTAGPWDGTPEHPYQYIQDGIDNANPKDMVFVFSGIYYETVVVNRSINLIGENKYTTIIDGGGDGVVTKVTDNNVNLSEFSIINGTTGIGCSSENNHFTNIICKNNSNGMLLYVRSNNNTITSCIFINNSYEGFELCNYASFNTISYCKFVNNGVYGIHFGNNADNNTFFLCHIDNNHRGMEGYNSDGNNIISCTFINNDLGIHLYYDMNNLLYNNNFIDNIQNAYDHDHNQWDNGAEGNYWDDYTGQDADGDGIGDTPYDIPGGNNQDRYPLVEPWGWENQPDIDLSPEYNIEILLKIYNFHDDIKEFISDNWFVILNLGNPLMSYDEKQDIINSLSEDFPELDITMEDINIYFSFLKNIISLDLEIIYTPHPQGVSIKVNDDEYIVKGVYLPGVFEEIKIRRSWDKIEYIYTFTGGQTQTSSFELLHDLLGIGIKYSINFENIVGDADVSISAEFFVGPSINHGLPTLGISGEIEIATDDHELKIVFNDPFSLKYAIGAIGAYLGFDLSGYVKVGGGVSVDAGMYIAETFNQMDPIAYAQTLDNCIQNSGGTETGSHINPILAKALEIGGCTMQNVPPTMKFGIEFGATGKLGLGLGGSIGNTGAKASIDGMGTVSCGSYFPLNNVGNEVIQNKDIIAEFLTASFKSIRIIMALYTSLSMLKIPKLSQLFNYGLEFVTALWTAYNKAKDIKNKISDETRDKTVVYGNFGLGVGGEIVKGPAKLAGNAKLLLQGETSLKTLNALHTFDANTIFEDEYMAFLLRNSMKISGWGGPVGLQLGIVKNIVKFSLRGTGSPVIRTLGDNQNRGNDIDILSFAEETTDVNNDGLYDNLLINVTLDVNTSGNYSFSGLLFNNTNCVGFDGVNNSYTSGIHVISFVFDGLHIRNQKLDGPYALGVIVDDDDSNETPIIMFSVYNTSDYNYSDFQKSYLDILNISHINYDTNGNNLYDFLKTIIDVNITESAIVNVTGTIYKNVVMISNYSLFNLTSEEHTVELFFDGRLIRTIGADSPYNLTITIFNEKGVILNTTNYVITGCSYTDFEIYKAALSDNYNDTVLDLDNDGLYDFLRIDIGVNITQLGDYSIQGFLTGKNASYLLTNTSYLDDNGNLTLYIDGMLLYNTLEKQNYTLENLILSDNNTILDTRTIAYITNIWNYSNFESKDASLSGISNDFTIDDNNNSLYEYLQINLELNITENATYKITGFLKCNESVVYSYNKTYLTEGNNLVSLNFNGESIYDIGFNGQYLLERIIVYKNNKLIEFAQPSYYTNYYNFSDFERRQLRPQIMNEIPSNNDINVLRPPFELNVTVYDPNSDLMNMSIGWIQNDYYHNGEWGPLENFTNVSDGSYCYNPSGNDWIWGNTSYIWSVNVTDGISWTNETYQYTTSGSRYDVNNDGQVNFQDAGLVWVYRTSEVEYDGIYDVNQDGQVNFQDAGLTWINRD